MVGDEPYLAMEYVEGVDLYRLLRRADADLNDALDWLGQAYEAAGQRRKSPERRSDL